MGLAQPGFASQQEVYAALIRQGAPPALANTLAAITRPESSGFTAANNGTYLGLFQIGNYHGFDNNRLLSDDIDYQAQAALQIYHQQGLGAWETYTNGSYQKYLNAENSAALPPTDLSNFDDVLNPSASVQQQRLGLSSNPTNSISPDSAPDTGPTAIDQPGSGPSPIDGPGGPSPLGNPIDGPIGFDKSLSPSGA